MSKAIAVMMDEKRRSAIQEIVRRLVSGDRPRNIILFGSSVHGSSDADSDINMLIVADTPMRWFDLATRDLARVERLVAIDDPSPAGFCLQQAVEKALKGYLLARGQRLRRIHDLEALLDDAIVYNSGLEKGFRPVCQVISSFYMLERYPLPGMGSATETDVRESLALVRPLLAHLTQSGPR